MRSGGKPTKTTIEQAQPTTLLVHVKTSGQIEIPDLGLVAPAESLTPARFDLFVTTPGRYKVVFRPAEAAAPETNVGTLEVAAAP
jgi:hypothetical protein